nr:reverse transcriptase domain-containing protein [Tanacetum cinerariifolium]
SLSGRKDAKDQGWGPVTLNSSKTLPTPSSGDYESVMFFSTSSYSGRLGCRVSQKEPNVKVNLRGLLELDKSDLGGNKDRVQLGSSSKQNLCANHEGCQLVDSPIILEALIEGFLVRRIHVDGGSSFEVMYEHCFQNLGAKTRVKLKESRTPLGTTNTGREESQGQKKEEGEPKDTIQPPPNPPEKDTQTDEEIKGKDEHPERPVESKPPKKVVIHDDYPNQTVTIRGNFSAESRFRLIEILRKQANDFA